MQQKKNENWNEKIAKKFLRSSRYRPISTIKADCFQSSLVEARFGALEKYFWRGRTQTRFDQQHETENLLQIHLIFWRIDCIHF